MSTTPALAARPDTRAPNPLYPGFARTWPDCQPAMRAITRHLLALGAEEAEVIAALRRDFPDLPVPRAASNPDAYYITTVSIERFALQRHPELSQDVFEDHFLDEPDEDQLQVVTDAGTLLALCGQYDIHISYDAATGDLKLSRTLEVGGPFWLAIKQYKPALVAGFEAAR